MGRREGERARRTYVLSQTRWHSCFLMEWMVGIVPSLLQFFRSSSATLQIVQALELRCGDAGCAPMGGEL